MIIGINASFLRKIDSGTGQVTANFLRQLVKDEKAKKEEDRDHFILYLEEDFSWSEIGLDEEADKKFFQKRIFLPWYQRDDLIRKIWWEKFLLPKRAQKDGCQVFFSLYQSATIFDSGKIQHLMLVHDVIWKIFPQYLENFRKKIYYLLVEMAIFKADKLLTVSVSSQKDLEKFFGFVPERITVAPIDCDQVFKLPRPTEVECQKVLAQHQIEKSGFLFYVGGFDQRKNVGFLIEAFGWLWKKYQENDWKEKFVFPDLVLAGKFNAHLVPLVEDLPGKILQVGEKFGLPKEKIKMVGFVGQKDLPAFYASAGLFCFPSLYEGFGLPPLEAFNCDCPALANRNSSLKEVTGDIEELSFLMDDPEKLAEKMSVIFSDEITRNKMIEAGRTRAQVFSWSNFNSKVEEELQALIQRTGSPLSRG